MTTKTMYCSDMIVEILKSFGFQYIAFNPGATFRGIHESLLEVEQPEIILCCHEEISVAIAHGYAKAAGRPMAVATHNVVGLQHASMAIFNAWCDRVPVFILGGTGPVDAAKRRPWIDWVHTALVQGNAVRDYVKWDDQPFSVDAIPESFLRGYRIMMTPPHGPIYICLDVELQEAVIEGKEVPLAQRFLPPVLGTIDQDLLLQASSWLVEANHPVIVIDYAGREPGVLKSVVQLAEVLAAPVIDGGNSMNFPNCHSLDATGCEKEVLAEADVVLALEVPNLSGIFENMGSQTRDNLTQHPKVIQIGVHDLMKSSWAADLQRPMPADIAAAVPAGKAAAELAGACQRLISKKEEREERRLRLTLDHKERRSAWMAQAEASGESTPIAPAWLALQIWNAIKETDWVLVNDNLKGWTRKLWQMTNSYQYIGKSGGAGLGYGIGASIGAALAHKGSGRLCIDIQGDGDFLFNPSALWTAARHQIPLLVVIDNNRTYYNSQEHVAMVASQRNRSWSKPDVGSKLEDPEVDFAKLALSQGVYAIGPVTDPAALKDELSKVVDYVLREGKPALIDVVTRP